MAEIEIVSPDWAAPLFENDWRYIGIFGGRGSGKSWLVAEYIVDACLEKRTDVVCVREIQKTLSHSVKKLIEAQIEKLGLSQHFEVQESLIKTPHGGKIIFQGMQSHNADSIKSLESIDIAWVEEAQTLSQRSLDLLRPTIRNEGSKIIFTWNPDNETDPVDVLMRKHVPDKSIAIEVNYLDNPWFPEVLTGEMEWDKARDYDKYEHIWLGKYNVNSSARVFKNWRVEEFEAEPGELFRFGADWGYAVDPSVLIRCYVKGHNLYVDYEAYMVGCEIVNLPDLFLQIPESEKWPIVADSARPETISHMQRNGFPRIRPAVKGKRSLEEGVNFLQSFDIIVHPRCVHTIDELKLYSYKVDPLTNDVLPMFEDKDNHIIDACIGGDAFISMKGGFKKLKDVVPGDEVLTRDGYKKVLHQWLSRENADVVEVNGLVCTPDHKVWVEGKGFIHADEICYGDELLADANGTIVPVLAQPITSTGNVDVYDLEVEGAHEFFANGVLVKNCSYALEGARRISKPTEYTKPIKAPVKHWLSR
jgi:phage terminase large subunit